MSPMKRKPRLQQQTRTRRRTLSTATGFFFCCWAAATKRVEWVQSDRVSRQGVGVQSALRGETGPRGWPRWLAQHRGLASKPGRHCRCLKGSPVGGGCGIQEEIPVEGVDEKVVLEEKDSLKEGRCFCGSSTRKQCRRQQQAPRLQGRVVSESWWVLTSEAVNASPPEERSKWNA